MSRNRKNTKSNLAGMLNTLKDVQMNTPESYDDIARKDGKDAIKIDINKLTPAPIEWNFFPPISESKMIEMMFSIMENGLFNPIIVWEQDNSYMILSGHNRVEAYRRIVGEYDDIKNNFTSIPAIVYGKNEIDDNKAKEIVIDTNYIQRDDNKRLMPLIIKNRIDIVRNRKDRKGRTMEIVARELGLSNTKVYEDQLIANKIIPELSDMYFDGVISKKALLRFAWFNLGVQLSIYDNYKDNINNDNCFKMRKTMNMEELRGCFRVVDKEKEVHVVFKINEKYRDEFRERVLKLLKEYENK